jgi:ATP-binding cassette subfamily C protein
MTITSADRFSFRQSGGSPISSPFKSTLEFFRLVWTSYPKRCALIIFFQILAGFAEGLSVLALLPLLGIVIGGEQNNGGLIYRIMESGLGAIDLPVSVSSLLGLMVVASIVKALLVLLTGKQVGYAAAQVGTDLRLGLIRGMMQARWAHFVSQPIGRLSNSISSEADRASTAFLGVGQLVASIVKVVAYIVTAMLISTIVTLLAIAVGVFIGFVLKRTISHTRSAGLAMTQTLRSLSARFADGLQGIKPLKAMGQESNLIALLEQENSFLQRTQEKRVFNKWLLKTAPEPILIIFLAAGAYVSLAYVSGDVESLLVMTFLFVRTVGAINSIQSSFLTVVGAESAFLLLHGTIREAELEREALPSSKRKPTLKREIAFDHVSFAFGDRPVLHDMSMTVRAGAITALVGPSGAGKTTVVDLVVGFFKPDAGRILIDGTPLDEIDQVAWRAAIGYVPQDLFLFHGDLATNVSLRDPAITEGDIEMALRAAGAWEFISELPEGIHTMVGERGLRLSGGQRQRIAIARALVRRPMLLILDEATTALDPATEAAICDSLRRIGNNTTVLAISHQPAITRIADKVYRIIDGRMAEERPEPLHKVLS